MSLRRRDLVLAGLGVVALGTAEVLRPRKRLVLLKNGTIAEAIPPQFGNWISNNADLVSPEQAGRLAKTLYSETVGRAYDNTADGSTVLILAAYGDTQSDLLQLHRPESCYPAVGYSLALSQPTTVDIGGGQKLPGRRVIAKIEERVENIIYWTRLGERLPQGGGEQRDARLANAMDGFVADGILVRCSVVGESEQAFATLERFIPEMLRSVRTDLRPALIGTRLAQRVA
ncbi:exosortase C-terminal domain/associated protein EpsI [Phenylobacterium sp.]|uniref:exosortase C-terminal domain/associated protein EpsI n=1 Tax=Phenylobacterium sp. TaxID=1871053 RepID=UPI002ED8D979